MSMKELLMGNEAVAKGAMKAGLGFYAGYPITPASEVMHFLAKQKELAFVNAEDEIASINMCLGASLAGKKVLTATSGPGFSLMQEAVGYGYMAEIPMVLFNTQRVGPSTGMPTLPAQGDILQAIHGSHGDTYPIVFYPNSVKEIYEFTIKSFNCAEEARQPVILLSDAFLSHMYEVVEIEDVPLKTRDMKSIGTGIGHVTGLLSKDGVPMTKDPDYYKLWIKKVKKKRDDVVKDYQFFEYDENGNDKLVVSFGLTSRVVKDLEGYDFFRPILMYPVVEKLKEVARKYKEIIVVEMNDGQYASILEKELKRKIRSVKVHGGYISLKEIKNELSE
jgi:2-oxoglutarate/2-oxoacid ferredoxin oxidoreductase subunit alpha